MNSTELQTIKVSPSVKFYLDNCLIKLIKRIDSTSVEENIIDVLFDFPSLGISLNSIAAWAYSFGDKSLLEQMLKQLWSDFNSLKSKQDINSRIGKIQKFWDKYKDVSGSFLDKEEAVEFLEQLIDKLPSEYEFKKIAEWVRSHTLIINDNDWKFDVVIPLVKELKSAKNKAIKQKREEETEAKKIEVKTSTPLKEPEGYNEADEESKQAERYYTVKDDPEYPYNVQAVEEIYKFGHYISFEEKLYKWNGKFYEKCDPGEEKQKIRAWAESTPVYDPRTKRETYKYLGTRYLNEIWNWALITFAIKPDLVNPPGLNLANGVLRVHINGKSVSWELTKHSPKDYFLYCSEVEYDETANPEYCDRLLECLDPAPRTAFLRQVGAALDLESVRKVRGRDIRAAICRGSGSNGKDSLHEAIALIFTDNQICSAGFNQFIAYDQGRQFTLAKLRGAKINWAPENNKNNSLDGSQSLNQAISGDRGLEYERKGKDAESFIPHCVHFFNVNQLPKITTGLESIMSRFAVYEFNKTFSMNPNPAKGELQADPRFKYDKDFIIKEVCPSLLNKMLAELKNLLLEGIDYNAIKHSLDDIQEESTHLWAFCHDLGITASADHGIYINDLWIVLQNWYIESGTLYFDEKEKPIWHDQANPYDRNITGSNQIATRFKNLFPKITRERETRDPKNKGRFYLKGLKCTQTASLLHFPINSSVSASPSASLSFTSSSLTTGEAKSEDKNDLVKHETLTQQASEAVKQKNTHQALKHQTRREELLETITIWRTGLNWDINQLKAFAKEKIGLESSKDMTESQLYSLSQLLQKEIPLQPKKQEF